MVRGGHRGGCAPDFGSLQQGQSEWQFRLPIAPCKHVAFGISCRGIGRICTGVPARSVSGLYPGAFCFGPKSASESSRDEPNFEVGDALSEFCAVWERGNARQPEWRAAAVLLHFANGRKRGLVPIGPT